MSLPDLTFFFYIDSLNPAPPTKGITFLSVSKHGRSDIHPPLQKQQWNSFLQFTCRPGESRPAHL